MTQDREPAPPIRFAADRMLGRLARMLRLLGYDTFYSPDITPSQLEDLARTEGRVLLTRGRVEKRFRSSQHVLSLADDNAARQLRVVVQRFRLNVDSGLWTRCTLCNSAIVQIEKAGIEPEVEAKISRLYDRFYRCSGCGHIYWRGSHVERIKRNLDALLSEPE